MGFNKFFNNIKNLLVPKKPKPRKRKPKKEPIKRKPRKKSDKQKLTHDGRVKSVIMALKGEITADDNGLMRIKKGDKKIVSIDNKIIELTSEPYRFLGNFVDEMPKTTTVSIWCMACRKKTDSEVIDIVPTQTAARIIGKCKVCSNATSGFTFKAVI